MYEPRSRALSYVRLSHPIVRLWPRAADFSIGPRRQLSEVHPPSYRRSRDGSP